mgnify:CR=1 FL=1
MSESQEQFNYEVQRSLGRIESKVDGVISRLDRGDAKFIDQGKKIDSLEERQANTEGKATVLGVIGGSVVGVVLWWIKDYFQKKG